MRKFFTLFAVALIAMACGEEKPTPTPAPSDVKLELTSEQSVWFEAEGGNGEISYTLEGEADGIKLEATSSVEWIANFNCGDVITFTVAKNETSEERRGVITVSYAKQNFNVVVMQRTTEDIATTFTAESLGGSLYYGNEESEGYNYYVMLSDAGVSDKGNLYGNSTYYCFDLYSAVAANGNNATIPAGEYKFDVNTKPGSIYNGKSKLTLTSASDMEDIAFVDARMVVTENSIEAYVTFESGEVHKVVYNGSLDIDIYSSTVTSGLSTLRSDYLFNIEGGVFVGAYVGDLMYTGCNTCQVYLFEYLDEVTGEERGDQFQLDLQLPKGGTDICGSYTPGTTQGHFIPGSAEDLGGQYMQQNTWYNTAGYVDFAPLVDGSIKVEKDADDVYTFTIECVDDSGNRVAGIFKGEGKFIEW